MRASSPGLVAGAGAGVVALLYVLNALSTPPESAPPQAAGLPCAPGSSTTHPAEATPPPEPPAPITPEQPAEPEEDEDDEGHDHPGHKHNQARWQIPLTWRCRGERAYLATALTFAPPTPARLGKALQPLARAGAISLRIAPKGEHFRVALSATEPIGGLRESFPPGRQPGYRRLVDGFGDPPGVSSEQFLRRGYLRLAGKKEPLWLEISQINWRAVEGKNCDEIEAKVYASIPETQWDLFLQVPSGPRTIRELSPEYLPSGPGVKETLPSPPPVPSQVSVIPLHFTFKATAVAFVDTTP